MQEFFCAGDSDSEASEAEAFSPRSVKRQCEVFKCGLLSTRDAPRTRPACFLHILQSEPSFNFHRTPSSCNTRFRLKSFGQDRNAKPKTSSCNMDVEALSVKRDGVWSWLPIPSEIAAIAAKQPLSACWLDRWASQGRAFSGQARYCR